MSSSRWVLKGTVATLADEAFSCQVDIAAPRQGLGEIQFAECEPLPWRLFALDARGTDAAAWNPAVADQFVRGDDVYVRYAATASHPFSPSVYWRAVGAEWTAGVLGGVQLIASVQTELLDSHPELHASTRFAASKTLRLADAETGAWQPLPTAWQAAEGDALHCLLVRPAEAAYSYVEMIHPADFRGAAVASTAAGETTLQLELLSRWMEKGVILRARAQGVFVPRQRDEQYAASAYQRFLALELPLTV